MPAVSLGQAIGRVLRVTTSVVKETVQVFGDERNGFVPVKIFKGDESFFTLLKTENLQGRNVDRTLEITTSDKNINMLWQHMKSLTEGINPAWTNVKTFYAIFDDKGLITISLDKPKETQNSNAELFIDNEEALSIALGNNMPIKFYGQVEVLNWFISNLKH